MRREELKKIYEQEFLFERQMRIAKHYNKKFIVFKYKIKLWILGKKLKRFYKNKYNKKEYRGEIYE